MGIFQTMLLFINITLEQLMTNIILSIPLIVLHDRYISSDESYQEYLDRLDNEILLHSHDRKIQEANKKFEKASNEIDSLHSKANENIINYIKMQFHEDISNFISTLSKQQILDIQDRLFDYTSIEELKKSVKKHQ